MLKLKNRACIRYTRTKQVEDKIEFNRLRALARYKIKQSKKSSLEKYVRTLNKDTPMKSVWKRVNKIYGKYNNTPQPVLEENNILITNQREVANKLGETCRSILTLIQSY